ncbi:MAG: antibiotic biosynthesis monooxygenase [Ignavibacteria bacterium]|nr:antibiotic biosynthesis monooxygenase [Ignavibacteria bacterium]
MSKNVHWIIEASVREGKLEDLKGLITEMVDATKASEPGAINYNWNFNDDESYLYLYERYADSDAALVHMGNFVKNFAGRFMSFLEIKKFVAFGDISDQMKKALSGAGAKVMTDHAGFDR